MSLPLLFVCLFMVFHFLLDHTHSIYDHLNDTVFCYCCCRRWCCCFVILFNWSYLFSMSFALKQFSYIIENKIELPMSCSCIHRHVFVSRSRTPHSQTLHHTHGIWILYDMELLTLLFGLYHTTGNDKYMYLFTSTFVSHRICFFIVIIKHMHTHTMSVRSRMLLLWECAHDRQRDQI